MSEANLRKALEDLLNMYVANVNSGDCHACLKDHMTGHFRRF